MTAIPPLPLDRTMLARPEGRRAIRWIAAAAERLGAEPSSEAIERELIDTSRSLVRARNAFLAPFEPVLRLAANRQSWFLFTSSTDIAHRLRVEARAADSGQWIVLYRAHHEDRLGLAPVLAYRRVRGIYNPSARTGQRPQYPGFLDWLAAKVLRAHPEYDALRVSMERIQLATRSQPNRELGIDYVVERYREDLR